MGLTGRARGDDPLNAQPAPQRRSHSRFTKDQANHSVWTEVNAFLAQSNMTRGYGWQLILISDFAVLGNNLTDAQAHGTNAPRDSWQPQHRTERGYQEGVVGVGSPGL